MSIRLKTKKLIYAGLAGSALTLCLSSVGGYWFYTNSQEKELELIKKFETKIVELEETAAQNEVAYTLSTDVEKGALITEAMLTKVYVPKSAAAEDIIELPNLKLNDSYVLYAKTDLKANTVLVNSMVYSEENITHDTREAEYSFIELPSKLKQEDYVDIRIQFPTGDDYVILTKKRVKDILGITAWLDVGESEILTMSSAVVDAYLVEGTKIYALPYVDEHMQVKSTSTYPVKENVRELIKSSPNVVNVAELYLENKNRERLENNLLEMTVLEREQVRAGDTQMKNAAENEKARLTEEERINAMNSYNQQQLDLIGGGTE